MQGSRWGPESHVKGQQGTDGPFQKNYAEARAIRSYSQTHSRQVVPMTCALHWQPPQGSAHAGLRDPPTSHWQPVRQRAEDKYSVRKKVIKVIKVIRKHTSAN